MFYYLLHQKYSATYNLTEKMYETIKKSQVIEKVDKPVANEDGSAA
jgi:hypothetical protein